MSKHTTVDQLVAPYFQQLGLEPDITTIYMTLHTYGPQNMLQLSRLSGVERTRLYRLLDTLTTHQLVEVRSEYKKTIISAAPITNLQILLAKRSQELRDLQAGLQQLHESLSQNSLETPATRVQLYRGVDGVKQMFWNQTKATGEMQAILYENMQNRTNLAFFERWVRRCNEQGLHVRGIIGDHFIKTQQEWYGSHSNERLAHWTARYVSSDTFRIPHSTIIYDNVVSHYNWKNGEIFGIETYNREIADAQRQLWTLLWQTATLIED